MDNKLTWHEKDHAFTPSLITSYERCMSTHISTSKRCSSGKCVMRPRALRNGKVIIIMKDGYLINGEDKAENKMIDRGLQLPEDYSGEPESFGLSNKG